MTETAVYCCDSTDCYWNHGQACSSAQIELDENHVCKVYILREVAEMAILENMKAEGWGKTITTSVDEHAIIQDEDGNNIWRRG